jgi:lipoprotein-anchoring transpeptidase ErfK/SrfK
MRVSRRWVSTRTISTERFWQIAILTAASSIGAVSHADGALYDWPDSDPGFYRPAPTVQPRRQRTHHRSTGKTTAAKEPATKPQGPLIIAVSIDKQRVRIFDDNGVFAEAPVSTGMPGHPTPTGVFSVIQKHKLHHSNIYSGAPMPYMQRITWSGVAMHAGVLPGYPASHGCIRMPMSFAVKMWNWTRMGARVFVTPGEIMTPVAFSHPLLATMKIVPQPVVADEPLADKPVAVKADKGAAEAKPAGMEMNLELRSSVGHVNAGKPVANEAADTTSLRDQTHTADAGGDARASKTPVTMSDARAGNNAPLRDAIAAKTGSAPSAVEGGAAVDTGDAPKTEATAESKRPNGDAVAAQHDETLAVDNKPVEARSAEVKSAEVKSAEAKSAEAMSAEVKSTTEATTGEAKSTEAAAAAVTKEPEEATTTMSDTPKVEANANDAATARVTAEAKAEEGPAETKIEAAKVNARPEEPKAGRGEPEPAKTETVKSDARPSEAKAEEQLKPDDKVKTAFITTDAKKDQSRPADITAPVVTRPDPPKRTGQIAVFISRKDSKLYVRQDFAPLFNVPITIAASDRPLGTHVFTVEVDRNDSNILRWSVVSLPMSTRSLQRKLDEERVSRRRKVAAAGPVEMKALPVPDSPAEALDRITIPADAVARITEALTTGGSIIVSDQGINQGETGEGTDFIVSLR